MDKRVIGEKIREARIARKLTQEELGKLLGGVKKNTVCQWELGTNAPRGETLVQVIKVLKSDLITQSFSFL